MSKEVEGWPAVTLLRTYLPSGGVLCNCSRDSSHLRGHCQGHFTQLTHSLMLDWLLILLLLSLKLCTLHFVMFTLCSTCLFHSQQFHIRTLISHLQQTSPQRSYRCDIQSPLSKFYSHTCAVLIQGSRPQLYDSHVLRGFTLDNTLGHSGIVTPTLTSLLYTGSLSALKLR